MQIRSLLTALVLANAPLVSGAQSRDSATFDIYFRGVKSATITYSAVDDGSRYSAAAKLVSAGVFGLVRSVTYEAKAQGASVGGRLVPSLYEETRTRNGEVRTVRMEYRNGVPQGRVLTPAQEPQPENIDPATQGGTWDVMTAIFAVFRPTPRADVCTLRQRLFDGRRVMGIRTGTARVEGASIVCPAEYVRIAGYPPEDMAERSVFPFTLIYEPAGGDLWRVARVEMTTVYGNGRMDRR